MTTEREIASIVWHQLGQRIEVIFVEGEPDQREAPSFEAREQADKLGLHMVPTSHGTVRWVRDSGS